MKDITDTDYIHAKRVYKDFDLYLKSDALLLANTFGNLREMCLKIYQLDPVKFLSAPGLAWQTALQRHN